MIISLVFFELLINLKHQDVTWRSLFRLGKLVCIWGSTVGLVTWHVELWWLSSVEAYFAGVNLHDGHSLNSLQSHVGPFHHIWWEFNKFGVIPRDAQSSGFSILGTNLHWADGSVSWIKLTLLETKSFHFDDGFMIHVRATDDSI